MTTKTEPITTLIFDVCLGETNIKGSVLFPVWNRADIQHSAQAGWQTPWWWPVALAASVHPLLASLLMAWPRTMCLWPMPCQVSQCCSNLGPRGLQTADTVQWEDSTKSNDQWGWGWGSISLTVHSGRTSSMNEWFQSSQDSSLQGPHYFITSYAARGTTELRRSSEDGWLEFLQLFS